MVTIIRLFAPTVGKVMENLEFYTEIQEIIDKTNNNGY
jgi:hypothetical protein